MDRPKILNPHPPEFERFLYATVGEDRNGYVVTVLSALARLDLDPWSETAHLVALGRVAARARLETLLGQVRDIPALNTNSTTVAHDLSLLLPDISTSGRLKMNGPMGTGGGARSPGILWTILALVVVLLQMLFTMSSGPRK